MLTKLANEIDAARHEGLDVPVKLRVHKSLFVPFAKWAMLLTGNYRCVTVGAPISICDAVHADIGLSRDMYAAVESIVLRIGAQRGGCQAADQAIVGRAGRRGGCAAGRTGRQTGSTDRPPTRHYPSRDRQGRRAGRPR